MAADNYISATKILHQAYFRVFLRVASNWRTLLSSYVFEYYGLLNYLMYCHNFEDSRQRNDCSIATGDKISPVGMKNIINFDTPTKMVTTFYKSVLSTLLLVAHHIILQLLLQVQQ